MKDISLIIAVIYNENLLTGSVKNILMILIGRLKMMILMRL
jgi:hypothetical protein